jgi:hypothetical protein
MRFRAEHPLARLSPRALLARVVGAIVFALAMLVPFRAGAAIVPACEVDVETRSPAMPLESACDNALTMDGGSDHAVDSVAAPMCGEQGISTIAPPRLLPVADARIDARTSCSTADHGPSVGPRSGDPPALSGSATLERATLDARLFVRPPPFTEMAGFPEPSGGPRAGFDIAIYHPPR